jgi:hypothetical protein
MTTPPDGGELQFESVVPRTDGAGTATACTLCHTPFAAEYFDVGGQQICRACSDKVAYQTSTPREMSTLVRAGIAGTIAAILGALLYFAVIAISGFEVGLVSIAIGYMVGYGIRLGTRGRGGRRFQVIALVLTYWAIGLAYSTLGIKALIDARSEGDTASISGPQKSGAQQDAAGQPAAPATQVAAAESDQAPMTGAQFVLVLLYLLGFTFVMPVLAIASDMPGGLISGAIIVFGMMQAWKMTAVPVVTVTGPYRIGEPAAG